MPRKEAITREAIAVKLDMIHDMLKDHVERFEKHVEEDKAIAKIVNDSATTIRVVKWVIGVGFAVVSLVIAWFK